MEYKVFVKGKRKRIIYICSICHQEAQRYLEQHLHRVKPENRTVCLSCKRERDKNKIKEIYRSYLEANRKELNNLQ